MILGKQCFVGSAMCAAVFSCSASAAQADVAISEKPTQNMSCSGGVCSPTASKAVLNVTDLANMLASGNVTVNTGGSLAKDIGISAALSWASTSRLTLDAFQSVTVKKPVSVTGTGALTITTNDGGSGGEFIIEEKGSFQFWDLNSNLIIDGSGYTLVGDIKTLAGDVANNPSGFYALAKDYDASADGIYSTSAITTQFEGTFEGLGNKISNFEMQFKITNVYSFGFFEDIGVNGNVRDFGLLNVDIRGTGYPSGVGALAGSSGGLVQSCWATGSITKSDSTGDIGGLVSANDGAISRSFAVVQVGFGDVNYIGGLVGGNSGVIDRSFSKGSVKGTRGLDSHGGGLVGETDGQITDSFSLSGLRDGKQNCCYYGGLVGENGSGATIARSYAAGTIRQSGSSQSLLGGLIGYDGAAPGSLAYTYWDLDKGISDPGQGAGNIENDPGIEGLTTQQLQSRLPKGFSPKIWVQDPNKNQGFPYLRGLLSKE